MPNVTLKCETCFKTTRRPLLNEAGSRGIHETASAPGKCPSGHGWMVRVDGGRTGWTTYWGACFEYLPRRTVSSASK